MELHFDKVLLVGDTHGNPAWWSQVVSPVAERLAVDAVVQLGDFGWWPHSEGFKRAVAETPVPVWFLDGNHEHHENLAATVIAARARDDITDVTAPVELADNLGYLPRGARFTVGPGNDRVIVAAVGGAHSIDRKFRSLGFDFFLEERLDDTDVANAVAAGHADVLLCHDAPAGWVIPGLLDAADLPPAWLYERPSCEDHREVLRKVHEVLQPVHVVHGHYHSAYSIDVEEPWGIVAVDGLDCDGANNSLATLTCLGGAPVVKRVRWR